MKPLTAYLLWRIVAYRFPFILILSEKGKKGSGPILFGTAFDGFAEL